MQYFDLYDLPISFLLDVKALKKKFYQLSKQFHPDFFTLESEEKQAEILELSTDNGGFSTNPNSYPNTCPNSCSCLNSYAKRKCYNALRSDEQ